MRYASTRDSAVDISASQAIINGISTDGGLYVPSSFPKLSIEEIRGLSNKTYAERATLILNKYLDFDYDTLLGYCNDAYSRFNNDDICPLFKADDYTYLLELTHGPTLAFKDMALTLLPYMMTASQTIIGEDKKILILVATSGDTGKAALEGFKDVPNTEIIVFYPSEGVSEMQKRQMQTQEGDNVHVCAIRGNFDDAQSAVKRIFNDKAIIEKLNGKGYRLSSANSINWGRLVPQIVYYFSAYVDLMDSGAIEFGDKINFVVPTGNFGNILAGYYAKQMGLPVNKLICASNSNKILTDFFTTGVYDINREFYKTISPSMDILISSNLERLLYELSGRNDKFIVEKMADLKNTGSFNVPLDMLEKTDIEVGFADENDTKMAIDCFFDINDYPLDTHTAVAITVLNNYVAASGDNTISVVLSTASPYKFPTDVYNAISHENTSDAYTAAKKLQSISGIEIPIQISSLLTKSVLHNTVVDLNQIDETIFNFLR